MRATSPARSTSAHSFHSRRSSNHSMGRTPSGMYTGIQALNDDSKNKYMRIRRKKK